MLAWVAFHDELWSGVAVVAAPGIEEAHGVDHARYALWIFTLPILISLLLEVPLALLSDRLPRRKLLSSALAVLCSVLVAAAASHRAWLLSISLALAGAASGTACAIAQAELIAAQPGRASQALARWMAFGAAGDALCAPLVAAALSLGASHNAALLAVAALVGLQALAVRRATASADAPSGACPRKSLGTGACGSPVAGSSESPVAKFQGAGSHGSQPSSERSQAAVATPAVSDAAEAPRLPLRAALREFSGPLWAFLIAAVSATLLDEIVVALATLRLHVELGSSQPFAAAAVTGFSCGSLLGAVATEYLLQRRSPRSLLIGSALLCAAALALFIAAPTALSAAAALCLLGAAAAPHYPLCKAAAYELAPGRPGLVNALAELFVVLDVVLPLALGRIADGYGVAAALGCLVLQPATVLVVAWRFGRRSQRLASQA